MWRSDSALFRFCVYEQDVTYDLLMMYNVLAIYHNKMNLFMYLGKMANIFHHSKLLDVQNTQISKEYAPLAIWFEMQQTKWSSGSIINLTPISVYDPFNSHPPSLYYTKLEITLINYIIKKPNLEKKMLILIHKELFVNITFRSCARLGHLYNRKMCQN